MNKLQNFTKNLPKHELDKIKNSIEQCKNTNEKYTEFLKSFDLDFADFHIHTEKSMDAKFSVKKILNNLVKNNIKYASLTDHNNIDSYEEAVNIINSDKGNKYSKLKLFSGVEFNVRDKENVRKVHMLLYDFDPKNKKIKDLSNKIHDAELAIHSRQLDYIENVFNVSFSSEERRAAMNDYTDLGFDNIAKVCMKHKENGKRAPIIKTEKEFNEKVKPLLVKYKESLILDNEILPTKELKEQLINHQDINYPTMDEFFEAAKESNGVPVVAHPYTLKFKETFNPNIGDSIITYFGDNPSKSETKLQNTEKYLVHLKKKANSYGLDLGCETIFKHKNFNHTFFNEICNKHKIIQSAGSDFHGYTKNKKNTIGTHEGGIVFKNFPLIYYLLDKERDISKVNFNGKPEDFYIDIENNTKKKRFKEKLFNKNSVLAELADKIDIQEIKENTSTHTNKIDFINKINKINDSLDKRIDVLKIHKNIYESINNVNDKINSYTSTSLNTEDCVELKNLRKRIQSLKDKYLYGVKSLHEDTLKNDKTFKEKYSSASLLIKESSEKIIGEIDNILKCQKDITNEYY